MNTPANTGNPSPFLRLLRFTLGTLVVLTAFYFLGRRLASDWHRLGEYHLQLRLLPLIGSYLILLLFHFPLGGLTWHLLLRGLGERLSVLKCMAIMTVTQLGKYAPGKVWFTLGRMSLASREGIPVARSLASVALEIGFALLAAALLLGIGFTVMIVRGEQLPRFVPVTFALIPIGLIAALPPILNRLLRWTLKLMRQPVFELHLSYPAILALTGLYMLDWFVQSFGCYVLINSFYSLHIRHLPILVGGYSISWIIGFLVLVAPAGLGVREWFYTEILNRAMTPPFDAISAIVTRIWMTTSEILMAVLCLPLLRKGKETHPG
ncbi:MAG: lysylphosphatidylglycerol synthase domain-containing protein [candidate division WOR-3 bacterium]